MSEKCPRNQLSWRTCLLALWVVVSLPVVGQAAPQFYAGKTIEMYAGYAPGGGIDTNMRVVARHLANHIPGHPHIIPKNMPGAGGAVLANYLYNKAQADGLTIGMPGRSYLLSPALGEPGAKYDALKFSFIGSPGPVTNIFWIRSATGIKTLEDLKKAKKDVVLGGLVRRSNNVTVPIILKKYMGWPLRVLPGYKGTSRIMLAMEQGEVDGSVLPLATVEANRKDLIQSKFLIPLFQTQATLPGVPVIWDLVKGKTRALLNLALSSNRWGVPLIGPPGIPTDRLAVLRKAFLEMAQKDKGFIKEAGKLKMSVGDPINGEELEKLVGEIIESANKDIVAEFQSLVEEKK